MSRILPAFHLTILLLPAALAILAAPSASAEPELRRLPITFAGPAAHLTATHRLAVHKTHHIDLQLPAETKSEALARAANLLAASGYTDIKSLQTEGDHVVAEVAHNDRTQRLVVSKDGVVAVGESAASTTSPSAAPATDTTAPASATAPDRATASDSSGPAPAPSAASDASVPAKSPADGAQAPVQTAAAAGSTSDAASPGALSASNRTP